MQSTSSSQPSVGPSDVKPEQRPVREASQAQAQVEDKALPGVHVTAAAVQYAKQRLAQRNTPEAAIRLGIRGGGCSGFSYVIEFSDDPPRARDIVCEFEGVRFYIDKKSM